MSISLLPVDLDGLFPDEHKVTAGAYCPGRRPPYPPPSAPGSSADDVKSEMADSTTPPSNPPPAAPPVSQPIMCVSDSHRGGDGSLFGWDRCVRGRFPEKKCFILTREPGSCLRISQLNAYRSRNLAARRLVERLLVAFARQSG